MLGWETEWPGVHLEGAVRQRREDQLQPSGQADGQRVRGIFQRTTQKEMSQCSLVPVARRCPREDRALATGLQQHEAGWIMQQSRNATMWLKDIGVEPQFLIRDGDALYPKEKLFNL